MIAMLYLSLILNFIYGKNVSMRCHAKNDEETPSLNN